MKKYYLLLLTLALLLPSASVLAEGQFDYIVIRGFGIVEDINISNPALTQNYYAFADFSKGEVNPPADPGIGYQVVRMYAKDSKGIPYDQLHYYPDSGYVFYDGIVNGYSELGTKWYLANPTVEEPFRAALAENARLTFIPLGVFIVLLIGFLVYYFKKPKQTA